MTSVRCLSLMRHTAMLCAALAFALGSASAQAVSAADDSASYSSSNAGSFDGIEFERTPTCRRP